MIGIMKKVNIGYKQSLSALKSIQEEKDNQIKELKIKTDNTYQLLKKKKMRIKFLKSVNLKDTKEIEKLKKENEEKTQILMDLKKELGYR